MTQHDTHGLHHQHKRKRIHEKHEVYPHPNPWKRLMDRIVYAVALIGPVMTLPQVYKIFVAKSAAGLSLISWMTYFFAACFWLAYGIMHKEKPLIFTSVLWVVLDLLIVIGIFFY
tara:strand:- start:87 stop:431 length:345 start_codon:yes stop_codon:yes gene_type:complete